MARSVTLSALVTFALIATSLPLMAPAGADLLSPTNAPLVIEGTRTYADGEFTFTQGLVVGPGATLVFRNARVWFDAPVVCWGGGGIGSYCHPSVSLEGGRVIIENSTVDTHTPPGPRLDGYWAIVGNEGVLELRDNHFRHHRIVGLQGEALEPSTITGNLFEEGSQALSIIRGAQAHIEGNTFRNLYNGVTITDTTVTLVNNHFEDIPILGVLVQDSMVGEKLFVTLPLLEGNTFVNVEQAITNVNSYPNRIANNTFIGGGRAIVVGLNAGENFIDAQTAIVEGNRIQGARVGIHAYVNAANLHHDIAVTMHAHGNSVEVTCTPVQNGNGWKTVDLTLDARYNWWGSADGPQAGTPADKCPATKGKVLVSPWLTEAP